MIPKELFTVALAHCCIMRTYGNAFTSVHLIRLRRCTHSFFSNAIFRTLIRFAMNVVDDDFFLCRITYQLLTGRFTNRRKISYLFCCCWFQCRLQLVANFGLGGPILVLLSFGCLCMEQNYRHSLIQSVDAAEIFLFRLNHARSIRYAILAYWWNVAKGRGEVAGWDVYSNKRMIGLKTVCLLFGCFYSFRLLSQFYIYK